MNKSRLLGAVCACTLSSISIPTHAIGVSGQGTWESTLQGRNLDGNAATFEAYYDTALDITWLADANTYGSTMKWDTANAWAAGLNVNGVTGWRLPTNTPVNGTSYQLSNSSDATTDWGYAPTTTDGTDGGWRDGSGTPVSEMGHMHYVTLGNLGLCDSTLAWCTTQSGYGLSNTGPFDNVQSNVYWSGSEWASSGAWIFDFSLGSQVPTDNNNNDYAWAVRSGDVSAVPFLPLIGVLPATPGGADWQAYYDPGADLTWLADANAGAGSSFDDGSSATDGIMTWANANAWAANLDIDGVAGPDGWRLPSTLQPDPSCSSQSSYASHGHNCTGSEMGNLFYNVLGNAYPPSWTSINTGPFFNVSRFIWSSTEYAPNPVYAWGFLFGFLGGGQQTQPKESNSRTAWAVHDGNVGASGFTWDVDKNGQADALTDGIVILRYLFGFRGETLIANAVALDAQRTTAVDIEAYLEQGMDAMDIDGSGQVDALTDGLLVIRCLFGFRGNTLIDSAVSPQGTRTGASEIEAYLGAAMP